MVRAEGRMSDERASDDIRSGGICSVGLSVKFMVGCVDPGTLERP